MTLKNVQYPPSERNWRAGRNTSFLCRYLLYIIAQFQSCLYCIYYIIMTSKKRVISLIKILYDYILRVHRICTIRIYTIGYMSLIIHINYYNILIITGTFCPWKMVNYWGHFVPSPKS